MKLGGRNAKQTQRIEVLIPEHHSHRHDRQSKKQPELQNSHIPELFSKARTLVFSEHQRWWNHHEQHSRCGRRCLNGRHKTKDHQNKENHKDLNGQIFSEGIVSHIQENRPLPGTRQVFAPAKCASLLLSIFKVDARFAFILH